jgi:chromosome segregation ATPase
LVNVESCRKKIYGVLVSYKTETLIENRSQIKQLEREIEKLQTERDALEEGRDSIEDEIANLEVQVGDLEEQIREHNRTSTMQNGRVNVAHARKKRRLDSELERVLETIEQKRAQMVSMDEKIGDTTRVRDEKENELIDVEKGLVGILVEQQKIVLGQLDDIKIIEEKNRTLLTVANIFWPPPIEPTIKDVAREAFS